MEELSKIEEYDFNIFNLKKHSNENELVTICSYVLAKEKIFDELPIVNEKYLPFIKKIQ